MKRRNRGWASGFQRLGYTIGEILSFILIALEVHKSEAAQDKVFYTMTGLVFFLGIFVVVFMVKDRKIPRNYTEDEDGTTRRFPEKLQKDDDENDTGSDLDIGLPEGAFMVKAKKANMCTQIKLIWSQKKLTVKEDSLNWLIFYASFVNKMCRDKFQMIIMIWYASYVVADDPDVEGEFNAAESTDEYKYTSTIALTAALFAVPSYGWLTDKLATEYELLLAYGTRCIAGFAFFVVDDPKDALVTWTIVAFVLASNFEEVCIDSLFSKRLPGDVRAAMISIQTFFSKLGHFTFACIALLTVEKYGIQAGFITVAIADATMVFITVIVSITKGFKEDPAAGDEAREKGKAVDAEL